MSVTSHQGVARACPPTADGASAPAAAPAATGVPPPVPFARTEICAEARVAAQQVLASGWVTTGPQTGLFEQEFAEQVKRNTRWR